MKKLLIILFFFMGLVNHAQEGPSYCATAYDLCDYVGTPVTFNSGSGAVCMNGSTRLFFKFDAAHGVNTAPGAGGSPFIYSLAGGATSSSVKIHGPFSSSVNPCDLINSFQAQTVMSATNITSYPASISALLQEDKIYYVEFLINSCSGTITINDPHNRIVNCTEEPPCQDCLPTFMPSPGKYVLSAWVREISTFEGTTAYSGGTTTYNDPSLSVNPHIQVSDSLGVIGQLYASGEIIDGWQKIEGQFTIVHPKLFRVELISGLKETLFDDIRVYPDEGSAITYVYDPLTYRLMAELDERNYATLYEYDEEGKLVRIKKETEKGIMTIQENRENNSLNYGQ